MKKKKHQTELVFVRYKRNSKHDVPCGTDCKIYPKGKKDVLTGLLGKIAKRLGIDVKTRPVSPIGKTGVWVQGKDQGGVGRHFWCKRPNLFYGVEEAAAEGR